MKLLQIILCILLVLAACKKTDEQQPPRLSVGSTVFSLAKTTAQPLEILVFTINRPTTKKPTEAIIGTLPMLVQTIDDTTFAVQIPEATPVGTYPFTIADGKSSVQVSVQATKPIADPTTYTQACLQQLGTSLTRLKTLQDTLIARKQLTVQAATATRNTMQQKITEASQAFMALSASDKRLCAHTLAANRATLDSLNTLLADVGPIALPGGRLRSPCSSNTEEAAECAVQKATMVNVKLVLAAASAVGILAGLVSKNLGVAAVASAIVLAYITSLSNETKSLTDLITLEPIIPAENGAEVSTSTATPKQFKPSQSCATQFGVVLRNVQESLDRNSPNAAVRFFVESRNKLRVAFEDKIGELTNISFGWPAPKQTTVRPQSANKLKITLSNGAKVVGRITDFVRGTFNVIFTTSEKTNQKFDYTLSYDYGGQTVSKTITDNTLLTGNGDIDLSDCQIKSLTGFPVTAAGTVDTEYTFLLDGTCKFSDKARFVWNFGDGVEVGNIATGQAKHTYKKSGKYTIQLRVFPLATGSEYIVFDKEIRVDDLNGVNNVYFLVDGAKVDYPVDKVSVTSGHGSTLSSFRASSTANADYKYDLLIHTVIGQISKTGDYLIERKDPTYYTTSYFADLSVTSRDASNKLVTKKYVSIIGKLSIKAFFAFDSVNPKITATFEFTAREISDGSTITVTGGYLTNY